MAARLLEVLLPGPQDSSRPIPAALLRFCLTLSPRSGSWPVFTELPGCLGACSRPFPRLSRQPEKLKSSFPASFSLGLWAERWWEGPVNHSWWEVAFRSLASSRSCCGSPATAGPSEAEYLKRRNQRRRGRERPIAATEDVQSAPDCVAINSAINSDPPSLSLSSLHLRRGAEVISPLRHAPTFRGAPSL